MIDFYKKHLSVISLIGLFIGIALGLYMPQIAENISFIGDWYVKGLKYFIVPAVFFSITTSIYQSGQYKDNILGKTLFVFVSMFAATFLVSSLIVVIINPARGFVFDNVDWNGTTTEFNILDMLINLIPRDFNKFITGGNIFFVILLAIAIGFILSKTDKEEKVISIIRRIKDVVFKILEFYMFVTPLASLSLMSNIVAKYGSVFLGIGLRYILTAYLCSVCATLLVMVLPVLLICHISPVDFIKKVYKIWLITVSTCSSGATLPYTIKLCKEEFGVPDRVTDIVVPLGTTIHMCGGAVSFALLGLFCSSLYGIEISFSKYLLMLVSATLINMAAPGIPNGGIVIGATYLQLLGIPLDFMGFYSGIYKLLDMCYTSLNVTDDIASNVIVYEMCKKEVKDVK